MKFLQLALLALLAADVEAKPACDPKKMYTKVYSDTKCKVFSKERTDKRNEMLSYQAAEKFDGQCKSYEDGTATIKRFCDDFGMKVKIYNSKDCAASGAKPKFE